MRSTIIGTSVSRIEGPEKVAGGTRFAADVILPGMLWGRILRSPHPHARVRSIDASAAWRVPGVEAVVTGQDNPGLYMGKVLRDLPVLCWDRVRYIGDRVAAVAAETPEAAEEALLRIDVDYEVLPAFYDPMEAMRPDAPLLHDDVAAYEGAPLHLLATDVHNGQTRLAWSKGDVAQGFLDADLVLAWISQIELNSLDMRPSGMERTIKLHTEPVNGHAIRSIPPLSWRNHLLTSLKVRNPRPLPKRLPRGGLFVLNDPITLSPIPSLPEWTILAPAEAG